MEKIYIHYLNLYTFILLYYYIVLIEKNELKTIERYQV